MVDTLIKLYEYTDKVTPLYFDCGNLCDKKCCKGNDNDGMLLFPGEYNLYENNENFNIYFDKNYQMHAIRCLKSCKRNERPLACRIFPYMFYNSNGKITVAPDIRAVKFCPVLEKSSEINKRFLRAMRISAKLIENDDEYIEYIKKLTDMLTDFNKL